MITVLKGGWLAAWDGSQHQVIEGGEVAFEGDKIVYVGPRFEGQADVVVDRPEWFICPGFINLHAHLGVDLMGSVVDIKRADRFSPSLEFSQRAPLFLEPSLTPEEQQQSAEISLVQQLRSGATTILDAAGSGTIWWLGNPPGDEEMLVDTVGRVGARTYLSLSYRSGRSYQNRDGSRDWHWDEEMGLAGLREGVRFAKQFEGSYEGRVQGCLCPHAVDNCSPELLKATLEAARRENLLIQIHTAQYAHEVDLIRKRYGDTPVGHLHNIGFLGPDIILGHCVFISGHPSVGGDRERDLKMIADSGSSVAHSPLPFARLGEAMYSLPRYLDAGINVGIGCDIWPADIISEMKLAWFLGKLTNETSERPTAKEVFTAASVGSADALGRSDLGRLVAGAKADIVCVDMHGFHFGPILDPIRSLVVFGTGTDVDSVYVDGKKVVDGGRVLNADMDKLRAAAPGIQSKLLQVAADRDPLGRTATTILKSSA